MARLEQPRTMANLVDDQVAQLQQELARCKAQVSTPATNSTYSPIFYSAYVIISHPLHVVFFLISSWKQRASAQSKRVRQVVVLHTIFNDFNCILSFTHHLNIYLYCNCCSPWNSATTVLHKFTRNSLPTRNVWAKRMSLCDR